MNRERWIWIGGWGIPPDWLKGEFKKILPSAEHVVAPPVADTLATLDWSEFDRVGGYSLGAFLLLKEAGMVTVPALLLAPFFAFSAEAGLGGTTEQARIRYLARWLKRKPLQALGDFYGRAGLDLPAPAELPYPASELEWGLEQLIHKQAPARLPETWSGVIGAQDPLLDPGQLLHFEPRLQIVPGVGHEPGPLLAEALRK